MTIQFFNLGENNTSILINFLQDALAKNNEFEIRFGKFYQDKQTNKTAFESNVDIPFFYALKKVFDAQVGNISLKNTKETIYKNSNARGNIKRIIDLSDNSETIMLKNTIKKYDIYDYDFRYSISYERSRGISLEQINLDHYEVVRYKYRISYALPFGHLDLTVVNQETQDKQFIQKHEIELEITNGDNIEEIIQYITLISQIRQNNFYVTPGLERRNVITEYKNLINANYFVGAQPESLCKDKISNLYKFEYSVTDKADGDRALLLINKTGDVYFLDNNINKIFKTDVKSEQNGMSSILDGELVRIENTIYFLAFDIFYFNNVDLRGNTEYTLKKRLEILKSLLTTFNNSSLYKILCKDYYFGNVFSASKKILNSINEKVYKNDGLVFTPVNEPYPKTKKWSNLLKWKPAELNTIDFFAVKIESNNNIGKWQLYVQGEYQNDKTSSNKNSSDKNVNNTVLFDIEKLCGTNEQKLVTYETTFVDDLIDDKTNMYYMSHTVIEFYWNSENEKFVPLRTRWDKTANPKKHGNFTKVACDIWNNIHNPIDKDFLLQFYSSKSNDKSSDVYFESMRRFHNKVKEQLYNKYCKNTNWLLELCSGKGGDMHKWSFNNIQNVHGYDICDRSIVECKRRFASLQKQNSLNYNFYNLDLTRDDSYNVIYKNNPRNFDIICCQFGFHYFFERENHFDNIIKILDTSLKTEGYFIITFLDNTRIDELFSQDSVQTDNSISCSYEKDGEIMYLLEKDLSDDNEKIYGNRLKITLNGNNFLGEGSDEWIINYNHLLKMMEQYGFECVESELFQNVYLDYNSSIDLTECEKDISFLNRYCVFKKRSTDMIKLPAQKIIRTKHSKFDFETIDLHQQNISIYKITSLYDIIDCINCITYKYYKNMITNKQLDNLETSFSEIQNMFNELSINYKPVFIDDPLDFQEYRIGKTNVYFTYHKHIVEKKTDDIDESTEYNNWYIIMHHDQILFDVTQEIQQTDETKIKVQNEIQQTNETKIEVQLEVQPEVQMEQTKDSTKKSVIEEYNTLKTNGGKITIKILKDFLQKLDIKSSGKKEELQNRLDEISQQLM